MPSESHIAADRTARDLLDAHEEHEHTLTATTARASFFPLLERLAADPRAVILVEHRAAGRVMLVHENYRAYVRKLEALVQTLLTPAAPDAAAFRLAGSMRLVRQGDGAPADDATADDGDAVGAALRELRAAERAGAAAKFADL